MELGNFSLSLSVKDLAASSAFYQKLGFKVFFEFPEQKWMILKNGTCTVGLFQGMFEGNLLTFNPGWDADAKPLNAFDDIRKIRRSLEEQGISVESEMAAEGTGPASFKVKDPDGNVILVDQHV